MNIVQKTITSVEVAEMVGKAHNELLKDIRRYVSQFNEGNLPHVDFFNESTYPDAKGQDRPCYLVTKKGCEFIGNKLTGIKGTEFTAKYINRFHDMESIIKNELSFEDLMIAQLQEQKKLKLEVAAVNNDLQAFKKDMPLLALECQKITRAKNQKVVPLMGGKQSPAYKDKSLMNRVYRDLESQLKREFGVDTYKAIKRSQCNLAIQIINEYQLPLALKEEIQDTNNQMSIGA